MADNVELNAGSGGATLSTDDLGGVPIVHVQRVKVQHGVDGSAFDTTDAAPLPVEIGDGTDQAVVSAAGGLSCEITAALPAGGNLIGQVDINAQTAGLALAANQLAADHLVDLQSEHGRNDAFAEAIAVGGELDDAAPVVATEGNVSPLRITAQRAAHCNLRNNAGTEIGTASDPIRTDPTGTTPQPASQSGAWDIADITGTVSLPTGAATAANQLAADHLVDLQSEHARNDAFSEAVAIGGELDDATPVVATEGNVSPVRITAQRGMHCNLRDDAGAEIGVAGNPLQVDVLSGGGGPEDTDDDIVAGGQSAVLGIALNYGWDGTQWERIATDAAGAMDCNITAQTAGLALAANQLAADHLVDLQSEHARNDAFSEAVAIGGELDDTAPVAATEGNVSPLRITAQRAAHCNLRNNAGTEVGTTANPLRTRLSDGTDEIVISAAGALSTEVTAALPAGTNSIGRVDARGAAAQGAAVTGNPVQVAAEAVEVDADPTAVDSGDVVRPIATRYGQLLTLGGHPNIITREFRTDEAETDIDIAEAIGATNHLVLLGIEVQISHAGSASPKVRIGFGAASVPTEPASTGASVVGMVVSGTFAPGSGIVKGNGGGIIGVGAAGEELRMTNDAPTGGSIRVVTTYYISA